MKKSLIVLSLFILVFAGCKKDDPAHNTTGPYGSLSDVYTAIAPASRSASMPVSNGGSIYASGGTRFIIPANAFMTSTGATVTGSVDVTVNDWLKKGEMIFGKVLPISGTASLESGGQAYISITQNGQRVYLKNGKTVQINLPQFGNSVPGMNVFIGQKVENPNNTVQWKPADSMAFGGIVYNGDTISIFSDSIGYCNADRFMSTPAYQTFTIHTTSSAGSVDSLTAVVLYDSYKGMWPLGTLQNAANNATHVPNIPVHLVVFGIKNGNFYGGTLGITPQTGSTYTVSVEKIDPLTFKQQLNGL